MRGEKQRRIAESLKQAGRQAALKFKKKQRKKTRRGTTPTTGRKVKADFGHVGVGNFLVSRAYWAFSHSSLN